MRRPAAAANRSGAARSSSTARARPRSSGCGSRRRPAGSASVGDCWPSSNTSAAARRAARPARHQSQSDRGDRAVPLVGLRRGRPPSTTSATPTTGSRSSSPTSRVCVRETCGAEPRATTSPRLRRHVRDRSSVSASRSPATGGARSNHRRPRPVARRRTAGSRKSRRRRRRASPGNRDTTKKWQHRRDGQHSAPQVAVTRQAGEEGVGVRAAPSESVGVYHVIPPATGRTIPTSTVATGEVVFTGQMLGTPIIK